MSMTNIVDKSFKQAIKKTGAVLDSDTAKLIKEQAGKAVETAGKIAKNLGDVNGDGKVDADDLKLAAEKAGIVWDKIDSDLKTALLAGGAVGIGTQWFVGWIPIIGQGLGMTAFIGVTAYTFIMAKISKSRAPKV